jgi:hypothetical protein
MIVSSIQPETGSFKQDTKLEKEEKSHQAAAITPQEQEVGSNCLKVKRTSRGKERCERTGIVEKGDGARKGTPS